MFKNNHSTEMCSGSEAGSYLRLIDSCITQLAVPKEVPTLLPRTTMILFLGFLGTRFLKATARIWPCLSCMCHIRSTANAGQLGLWNTVDVAVPKEVPTWFIRRL